MQEKKKKKPNNLKQMQNTNKKGRSVCQWIFGTVLKLIWLYLKTTFYLSDPEVAICEAGNACKALIPEKHFKIQPCWWLHTHHY